MKRVFRLSDSDSTNSECEIESLIHNELNSNRQQNAQNKISAFENFDKDKFIPQIQPFLLNDKIKGHVACLILGSENSGNTNIVKNIISNMKSKNFIDECVVFNPDDNNKNSYKNITDKIYESFDDGMIEKIVEVNKIKNKKLILIFDDCVNENYFKNKNNIIQKLISNGGSYNISVIIASHILLKMSKELSSLFNFIFIGRKIQKQVYAEYFESLISYNNFNRILDNATNNFDCMVLSTFEEKKIGQINKIFFYSPQLHDINENISSFCFIDENVNQCKTKNGTFFINKFNENEIANAPAIVIIGKRGCGKSHMVKHLTDSLNKNGIVDECVIICPADRMNKFYENNFNVSTVYHNYNSEIIEQILKKQTERLESDKDNTKTILVILDDCLGQKRSWMRDKPIQELFFNGKHYKIGYILTMQFPLGIAPELRCNFDYIFLAKDDYIPNQKRIYDYYAGMFPTFDSFKQVYDQLTEDFGFMTIVNRGFKKNLLDRVNWHKAKMIDKCNVSNFVIDYKEYNDDRDFNIENYLKHKINVNQATIYSDEKNNKPDNDLDYELLEEIVNCNQKICGFVKNIKNDKNKAKLVKAILKCNNEILSSLENEKQPNKLPQVTSPTITISNSESDDDMSDDDMSNEGSEVGENDNYFD